MLNAKQTQQQNKRRNVCFCEQAGILTLRALEQLHVFLKHYPIKLGIGGHQLQVLYAEFSRILHPPRPPSGTEGRNGFD